MIDESGVDEYVKALSSGDSKAFELLFLRYQPKLVYFLPALCTMTRLRKTWHRIFFQSLE